MKMLITGASGALGSHVARQAIDAGTNVRGMSRRERRYSNVPWRWVRADLASAKVSVPLSIASMS